LFLPKIINVARSGFQQNTLKDGRLFQPPSFIQFLPLQEKRIIYHLPKKITKFFLDRPAAFCTAWCARLLWRRTLIFVESVSKTDYKLAAVGLNR
jgi:hypothetical protein